MNKPRRPTMMDVAAKSDVSQTTVSLVLNGIAEDRVSGDTIRRVREAANALGYVHRFRDATTKTEKDRPIIGLIVDEISTDPWMALALEGARDESISRGVEIVTVVTNGDPEAEIAAERTLSKHNPVGLIYGVIQTRLVTPPATLLQRPIILLNCYLAKPGVPSVVPGEVVGGRSATRHLIDQGHRRIAIIQGEAWMDASQDRLKGYRQALAAADIVFDEVLVRPGNWEPSAGYDQTIELMQLPVPPTAIFCSNDMMALGCYEALRFLGLRVPDDVSVVGYDDREIAQFLHPPLTTVLLPHYEMGGLAVELLLEQIGSPRKSSPQLKVECPMVLRQSVTRNKIQTEGAAR
jgi:LacI family transcriptional regulator